MSSDVSFTDPALSFDGPNAAHLPWNYLPVALPEMLGQGSGRSRIVMVLPTEVQPARYAAISAATLSDPAATADFIGGLDGLVLGDTPPETRCFLGPETDLKPFDANAGGPQEVFEISAVPWPTISGNAITQVVVIIDAGIAFWNRRFRGQPAPRFRGVRYLTFEQPNLGQSNQLDASEIAAYCAQADQNGNAAVMLDLGARFTDSVFGPAANPDPDGLWHGTAIADLAAGAQVGEADHVALYGLELPAAVLRDFSGKHLTQTLAMILPAAIGMTTGFAGLPLTIVMPLGFSGGPQDGTHPAAVAIDKVLRAAGRSNIRLVLPGGNHLQERFHARLNADGAPDHVYWDLPPDDHSVNAVEIFAPLGQPARLSLAAPGQSVAAATTIGQTSYRWIEQHNQKMGAALRAVDALGRIRIGLAMLRTATTRFGAGVTSGRWTLSSAADMQLWVARDDSNRVADQGRTRRPSGLWDTACTIHDAAGGLPQGDDPGSAVRRRGTLSVLATARNTAAIAVQAMERLGGGSNAPAGYSSRPESGADLTARTLVDDGRPGRGTMAAANGGARRVRVSGTSAAAGLQVRHLVLPNLPPEP